MQYDFFLCCTIRAPTIYRKNNETSIPYGEILSVNDLGLNYLYNVAGVSGIDLETYKPISSNLDSGFNGNNEYNGMVFDWFPAKYVNITFPIWYKCDAEENVRPTGLQGNTWAIGAYEYIP